jgi:hypothetical protein
LVKLQQYYIFKINTNYLKSKKYNINLSLKDARKSGMVVSLGDSQMLRSLRLLKHQNIIQEEINFLLKEKQKIKKKKSSQENCNKLLEIEQKIDENLFVPEIISVLVDDIRHYTTIGQNGFILNNKKYKRLLCGAGQARRNNALFIQEDYEIPLKNILNNNHNPETEITPAKYSAYFALASSASIPVSEPYFCIVPDYEIVRTEQVDYIEEIEDGDDLVYEADKNITFNLWDGQGIISPRQAQIWANDLELDYIPSNFIIRANFLKGMVCVIDFHKFAEENNKKYITDIYGKQVNILDVDIILTQSQFKLWNAYNSTVDYIDNCRKNNLGWGITRVSPKQENNYTFLNYQFIQALNLNDQQIKFLCNQTLDYFSFILKNKIEYTLLYLLGKNSTSYSIEILSQVFDNVTKALILNNKLIEDPYIKNHILHSLNKKIKESYIGNLLVDGQYTMMVNDPYAFMEYIFGLPIDGLLKRNEHYNKYWIDKNVNKIAAMRAPLTYSSEVNILNLKNNEKIQEWYQYLNSCAIYNVFGLDDLIHGGSDRDGDIVCLTNNQSVIDGVQTGLPIYYDVKKTPKQKIIESKLYLSDIKGFNQKIGFVTNCATSATAMLSTLKQNTSEYNETLNRLKRFRKEQGNNIDSTKGLITKPFPVHWTQWRKISGSATEQEKQESEFYNKIVINKRPLFMRHLYSDYNNKYSNYINKINSKVDDIFHKPLYDILSSGSCISEEENKWVKIYFKYNPFIESDCLMNKICNYMEENTKELKRDILNYETPEKIISILKNKNIITDPIKYKQMHNLYDIYKSEKNHFKQILNQNTGQVYKTIEQYNKVMKQEAFKISSNGSELANLAIDICYIAHPKDNKNFAWNIFGDEIIKNVFLNKQEICKVPFKDKNGDIKYMNEKYKMFEINSDLSKVKEEDIFIYDENI